LSLFSGNIQKLFSGSYPDFLLWSVLEKILFLLKSELPEIDRKLTPVIQYLDNVTKFFVTVRESSTDSESLPDVTDSTQLSGNESIATASKSNDIDVSKVFYLI
jgi:hypothetical protein